MSLEYLSLDVLIQRDGGGLSARVIASPAGEASVGFAIPASLDAISTSAAHWSTDAVRTAGTALFEAVFSGELLACYRSSLAEARRRGKGLRLRFRLGNAPDLAWVPWEILCDPQRGFLAQSADTTIVRYLELPEAARLPRLDRPLRILVVLSNPDDPEYPAIRVERERAALEQALGPLQKRGHVRIEFLEDARLEVLQDRLQTGGFHVMHFVGHSGFDASGEEGLVVLETSGGRGRPVTAETLRSLVADHDVRLVVLNSCESARPGSRGPFSGVAQALVQAGIPAVVAMQFPIRDDAASTLVCALYRELALSRPIDAAIAEGRKSVSSLGGAAWATPVVFLRARDGRIFAPAAPTWGEWVIQGVPYALLTLNWLTLLFAVKQIRFFFVDWATYLGIVGAALAAIVLLVPFIQPNWATLIPRLLSKRSGGLRVLPALASLLLSIAFLGAGLSSEPSVMLEHVRRSEIDSGRKLEIPATTAGVSRKNLCEASGAEPSTEGRPRSTECEKPLPSDGFLRLEYRFGLSHVSSYCVRLTVEPADAVGLAALRTDPAFELVAHPSSVDRESGVRVRARTAGNYEVYITNEQDNDFGDLSGTIEIRLLGRELYRGRAGPMPRLRATFAADSRGEKAAHALTGCWSLLDGGRIDCSAFASSDPR